MASASLGVVSLSRWPPGGTESAPAGPPRPETVTVTLNRPGLLAPSLRLAGSVARLLAACWSTGSLLLLAAYWQPAGPGSLLAEPAAWARLSRPSLYAEPRPPACQCDSRGMPQPSEQLQVETPLTWSRRPPGRESGGGPGAATALQHTPDADGARTRIRTSGPSGLRSRRAWRRGTPARHRIARPAPHNPRAHDARGRACALRVRACGRAGAVYVCVCARAVRCIGVRRARACEAHSVHTSACALAHTE